MNHQIDRAMKHDVTLMIAGVCVPERTAIPKQFADYSALLITLTALSFQMFCDPNETGMMSMFLSVLGVTHHATVHPPSMQLWQQTELACLCLSRLSRGVLITWTMTESKYSFNVLNHLHFISTQ
jgi:hypothetical protein